MLENLNRQIQETKEQERRARRLKIQLEEARRSLEVKSQRRAELATILQREEQDVKKLEGMSLERLFHTVLGSQEDKLKKERQEALAARLKLDQARAEVSALEADITYMEKELAQAETIYTHLEDLLRQKEALLSTASDPRVEKLAQISRRLALVEADRRETREAVEAGRKAQVGIAQVVNALQSADTWGVFDLLGGGLLTTAVKHSRIDEARDAAQRTQVDLDRFLRELADIRTDPGQISVSLDAFESFADYFFDGLIVDWVIQSRIETSLKQAEKVSAHVDQTLLRLNEHQKKLELEAATLVTERQRLLESDLT